MNETLIANGWFENGGCKCNGGAKFYTNKDCPLLVVEDFYKGHFWVLKNNNRKIAKGTYNESEKLLEQIKIALV